MMRLLFDSESNGFVKNATKVHCIGAKDVDKGTVLDWKPDGIPQALEALDKADTIIGHNIQRHDIPLLTKLYGWKPRPGVIVRDTMVLARLIYPNVKDTDKELIRTGVMPAGRKYAGKHTIGAWGYRLHENKGDYAQVREAEARALGLDDDEAIARYVWGEWNPEMHEYMLQDVDTNYVLWKHLNVDTYSQAAIELEHRAARVCDAMQEAGVPFDLEAAGELHATLVTIKDRLEKELVAQFGTWYQPISPNPEKSIFTPKKDNKRFGYIAGASSTKIERITFNPASNAHIIRILTAKGWKPTEFTEGGQAKVDETILQGLVSRFPEAGPIAEYKTVVKRLSQLAEGDQAWLKAVDEHGFIHGVINPMGTTTSRAAHMFPNLGQVPATKKPYGKECRGLFSVNALNKTLPPKAKKWKIVGADQEGLELRGLAHYLAKNDGGSYGKVVCGGDPHWMNAVAMGLSEGERDKHNHLHTIVREEGAKRFIYAYVYGAFDFMVGQIIFNCLVLAKNNGGADGVLLYQKFFGTGDVNELKLRAVGKRVRDGFAKRIPGYAQLLKQIGVIYKKYKRVPGLDGRQIPTRAEHSALNFLIQSAGAIICKRWLCDAFDDLSSRYKHGWDDDFVFILWVHDEIQVACREGLEEEVGECLVRHARAAGEPYGFRVPLDSKYSVGLTWADTH